MPPLPEPKEYFNDLVMWLTNITKELHGIFQLNNDNLSFYWENTLLRTKIKTLHDAVHTIKETIIPDTSTDIDNDNLLSGINLKSHKIKDLQKGPYKSPLEDHRDQHIC